MHGSGDFQLDEYPPAVALEGGLQPDGSRASVRLIDASDNEGAGARMGNLLNSNHINDGELFCIEIVP
jgi:hypothetical protein